MKIYFLNPPFFPRFGREMRWQDTGRGGTLYYPIWLSYAAGLLESNGHKIRLVDCPAWNWSVEDVLRDVKAFSPEMIVVDTSFTSLNNDLDVARQIKKAFDVPVVMVGPPTSQFPEKMLEVADFVARYEYDYTVLELAEGKGAADILGLSYKRLGKAFHNPNRPWIRDLDGLPFVSKVYKEHLNVYDYFLNYSLYPMVQIFTGRGCPFRCTFCAWPQTFMGRGYRVRRVKNILDELTWVEENMPNVKEVFFEDDTFTVDKKRVIAFCEGYKERSLDLSWSCNARVDTLDFETMREMNEANCRFLIVGFESADGDILNNIKKGFTVERAREFAKNVKKAGLLLHADFIIGLPGETKETIEKTRRFIKEIKPDQLQVSVVTPFLGTELYSWCGRKGYLLTNNPDEYLDEDGHQKSIVSYPWLSAKEIAQAVDNILKDYYLSFRYVPVALKQVLRRNCFCEFKRVVRSARMFVKYAFRK